MNKIDFITKYNMTELSEEDGFLIDIIYATPNNFTKEVLYNEPICMLRKKTADKLKRANSKLMQKGFKIKIWDSFRPIIYQRKMFEIYPDENFVANPDSTDCPHCKGSAIDVTLCTLDGDTIKMPTEFDHFGIESSREYYTNLDTKTKNNVLLLEETMKECGFVPFLYEWWHFDDSDEYEIISEMYEQFSKKEEIKCR